SKQKQIQAESHSLRFGWLQSPRPINRKQDVVNGGSIEIGRGGNALPINKREAVRKCFHRSGHAIAPCAAQLEEILRSGNGDEEASVVAQDPTEFAGIH